MKQIFEILAYIIRRPTAREYIGISALESWGDWGYPAMDLTAIIS